jgi:hypothetical protein
MKPFVRKWGHEMLRWPPRFTVRTLTIAVTLLCVYFGTWELTKGFGVMTSEQVLADYEASHGLLNAAITAPVEDSPMPFLIRRTVYGYMHGECEYYLWFFGARVNLSGLASG